MSTAAALGASPLPAFAAIEPERLEAAIRASLTTAHANLETLLGDTGARQSDLIMALEGIVAELEQHWSTLRHLHSVADSPPVRAAYQSCLGDITAFHTEVAQSPALFEALTRPAAAAAPVVDAGQPVLDAARELRLRDMRLAGADLDSTTRARVATLKAELADLSNRFSTNVLDASQAWTLEVRESELEGLPEHTRHAAAQAAADAEQSGFLLKLDAPTYLAVMQHAAHRPLREQLYRAWVTRASDQFSAATQFDNSQLMEAILGKRHELAGLLGFETFAHLSVASKMAVSPAEVLDFLRALLARARPAAQTELTALTRFAQDNGHAAGGGQLAPWDIAFWSERQRERSLGLDQNELRPYFPLTAVLDGMFAILHDIYGISVEAVPAPDTWHADVRVLQVADAGGAPRGYLVLDPFARNGKRSGAWMDECRLRCLRGKVLQLPAAYLTCNFTPPPSGGEAELTHDEVLTLFHETGHGLHHLLTDVEIPSIGGINGVAWDAVELPSQLLENWCWEPAALARLTRHTQTGAQLDDATVSRLRDARTYQAGLAFVRQLEFALFDMHLHLDYEPSADANFVAATLSRVREAAAVYPVPDYYRFAHAFSHIFAGGYAAGYYSYKWAEVLASDAFASFEETGLFATQTGMAFRTAFLARGGSAPAAELYREFRGRDATIDALLRHNGLD